jgi:hypothetical protein
LFSAVTPTRSGDPRATRFSWDGAKAIRTLRAMRLEGIQNGDIVEVDRLGRRFHALVTGNASGGLSIQSLDRRIGYRSCRAHDVIAQWAKRGRPRATNEPLEPSPLRRELDTTIRD